MADSNLAQLAYFVEEALSYDDQSTSGDVLTVLRYTSESLSFDITNTASQEIRSDRSAADLIQTGAAISGGFNFELSAGSYDDFIAGAMYSPWSTPLSTATSVGISSSTSASTITSTATDTFTHVSVGQWLKVTGLGAATTVNYYRVVTKSTSSTLLVWGGSAAIPNQSAGSVCKVEGCVIRNGTTEKSFGIEKKIVVNSSTATNVYFKYAGLIANQFSVSAKADAVLTGSFSFMGATPSVADASHFQATTYAASTTQVLNATSNVGGVYEGRPFVAIANCLIQGIDISLNNNTRAIKGIGSIAACDIGVGQCDVTGSLTAYFFDKSMYAKYIAGTETAVSFRTIDASGKGYVFTLPRIKIETDKTNIGGQNQDILEQLTYRALYDSVSNCTIQIDKFS